MGTFEGSVFAKKNGPLAVVSVALFWFASTLGKAYRISPGSAFAEKSAKMFGEFGRAAASFGYSLFDLKVGAAVTACFVVYALMMRANKKNYRLNKEYGSAKWGTKKDIAMYQDDDPRQNIILTQTEGLTMSSRPKKPEWAKYGRNKNVLVIGGSGSGKTRFFVKPNIMQMHSSYCVTDPKGTVLLEVGKMLESHGYRIKVLNTIDFKKSMHYNPFSYIRSEKDILKLVTALISNTKGEGKSGDDFWVKAETLLYCALIGMIHFEAPEDEQNMNTLVEMINMMETREDDENFKNAIDLLFDELAEKSPQHFAVRQYEKYKLAAGKTAKSILISCGARLAPFDIAEMRDLVMYDELEIDTIGDEKTALFVVISDTDSTFNFIVGLMYSQLFDLLCDKASEQGGRLKVHVRCLLDEFANIGMIPEFEKKIAIIRSREISACIILQAQSQLKAIYKDNADTIVGNCDSQLFLGGKEKTTLKDLAESLGKETIDSFNTSETKSQQNSYGKNYQKLGRELMSVDEIGKMDGGKCILQIRGAPPFFSEKYDITKHKHYKELLDYDEKNVFDLKGYLGNRIKARADNRIEMFDMSAM